MFLDLQNKFRYYSGSFLNLTLTLAWKKVIWHILLNTFLWKHFRSLPFKYVYSFLGRQFKCLQTFSVQTTIFACKIFDCHQGVGHSWLPYLFNVNQYFLSKADQNCSFGKFAFPFFYFDCSVEMFSRIWLVYSKLSNRQAICLPLTS